MGSLSVTYAAATDVGRRRANNEDAYIATQLDDARYIVLAAIDGMGGTEGGEVAAAITRDTIVEHLNAVSEGAPLQRVKNALTEANNRVVAHAESSQKLADMGCVATVGLIDLEQRTLSVAHVGDSRLYRLTGNELTKLTNDHSMVGYQEEQGLLTEAEAMNHPYRSIIERYVGQCNHNADDANFIQAAIFPLIDGETFLFCSDGLSDVITSADIKAGLTASDDLDEVCHELIDRANAGGGKDNITVVVAHVTDEAQTPLPDSINSTAADKGADTTEPSWSEHSEDTAVPTEPTVKKHTPWPWIITTVLACAVCLAIGYMLGRQSYRPAPKAQVKTETAKPTPKPASKPTPIDSLSTDSSK